MDDGRRGTEFGAPEPGSSVHVDEGRWGTETSPDIDSAPWPGASSNESRVEIVAEPIRYPRSPLIALLAIAIVPTVALFLAARWADDEADRYESTRDDVALLERRLDGTLAGTEDGDADAEEGQDGEGGDSSPLSTAIIDFRRSPQAISSVASVEELQVSVDPVLSFIGAESCAAVSVGGVMVTSSNLDLPVIPASNQKLLVATAALEILGDDFRFETSVAVPTADGDGVVEGDIFLIGGGDPLLTSNDFPVESDSQPVIDATSLDVLADAVAEAGITRIRGTVIGDGTRYDDETTIDEWADGVAFVDAGPYDALMANDSRVVGRNGREDDPVAGAAREFVRLLGDRGVRVDNGFGNGAASTLVPTLASVQSAPLTVVVAEMLTTSDNNTAEMLIKEIGFATSGDGTRFAGLDAMLQSLDRLGVPTNGVTPRDGSGLSNQNRVTCAAVLDVVQLARGGAIDAGLPVAAESGTLADEFLDSPMAGRLRAKTGTLNNEPLDADPPAVKALAGFVDAPEGSSVAPIEFVLIANTPDVSNANIYQPLWKALGERFDTYPAGPSTDSLGPR